MVETSSWKAIHKHHGAFAVTPECTRQQRQIPRTLNKQSFWQIIAFGLPVFLDSAKKTPRKWMAVWWPKEKGKPQTQKAVRV